MEVFVSRDFTYVSLSVFQACGTLAWFQKSPLFKKPRLRTAPSHPSLLALQAAAPALGLPQAPVSLLRGPVSRPWGVSLPPADQVLPLTSRCFIGACARAAFLSSPPVRMCCDFNTPFSPPVLKMLPFFASFLSSLFFLAGTFLLLFSSYFG